jgi:hypothetical protein
MRCPRLALEQRYIHQHLFRRQFSSEGEIALFLFSSPIKISRLRYRTWFRLPYVARVLLDRPVARKLARARNI